MKKIIKYSLGVTLATFSILGFVYAANTITGLGQTINDGDTIGAGWFNEVSTVLNGPKADGKMCTFSSGKISCVNNLPGGSSSGGGSNWTKNGVNISYTAGNVGVGVTSPTKKLDVSGGINTDTLSIGGVDIHDLFLKNLPESNSIPMNFGQWSGSVDSYNQVTIPSCPAGYTPKIEIGIDWMKTSGTVDSNDLIGTWFVEEGGKWYVGGGNYDYGSFYCNGRMKRGGGDNVKSQISYTTYCVKGATSNNPTANMSGCSSGGSFGGGSSSGGGSGGSSSGGGSQVEN